MPTPRCRKCGSTDITATSSQQMRARDGKNRLHADAVCNHCGHQWWSIAKAVLRLAREADKARTA